MSYICSICCNTLSKDNIIQCFNMYEDNTIKTKDNKPIIKHCNCQICSKCFMVNYMTNNVTYHFNCPNCKQLLNYVEVLKVLQNDKDNFNEFIKKNNPETYKELTDKIIDNSIYKEFVKNFKNKILFYEKGNMNSIECSREMFNKYIKTKKENITLLANRDEEYNCSISMNDINDIINSVEKNVIYYNNWQELHKKFNDVCLTLINEISKDLDIYYNEGKEIDKELNNKIINNKKTFVKLASEIIYNAKLLNDTGTNEKKDEEYNVFSPCPKQECLGLINKYTHRCNNCNNLCCVQCSKFLYEHEQYDKEKDLLFDKNNKISPDHPKNYIHVFNEEGIKELNDIRNSLHLKPFIPNENNKYIISCNRNDYEDYQFIIKDSKPCPNCKEMIHRWKGCNQMFCIKCHECYDYITGQKLDKKLVHNDLLANYLESMGKKMDFSDIKCDALDSTIFLQLNKVVLSDYDNELFNNVKIYFRKHNEIKDYVYNNNTRGLNDKIIEILKKFVIEKNIYRIFDIDYSTDEEQTNYWINKELNIIKDKLYVIYDEMFGKNIILEYYQTLGQGMNDTFLSIQSYLLEINKNQDKDNKELYDKIKTITNNLIKWYNEMKELVINTEKILNLHYKLIDLNDMN